MIVLVFFFDSFDFILGDFGYYSGRRILRLFLYLLLYLFHFDSLRFGQNFLPIKSSKLFFSLTSILFCLIISLFLQASNFEYIYQTFTNFLVYVIIPIYFLLSFLRNKVDVLSIPKAIVISSLFYFSLFYSFVDIGDIDFLNTRDELLKSEWDTISISRLFGLSLISSVSLTILSRSYIDRLFSVLAFFVSFSMVLIMQQRGTLIGILFAILIFLVFMSNLKQKSSYIFYTFLLIVGYLLFIRQIGVSDFGLLERLRDLQEYQDYERYNDYQTVFELFLESPIYGYGTHGYFFNTGRVYPHSLILDLIVSYGLFGFLISIFFILGGWHQILNVARKKEIPIALKFFSTAWISLFFSALVSSSVFDNVTLYQISFIVLIIYRVYSNNENLKTSFKSVYLRQSSEKFYPN